MSHGEVIIVAKKSRDTDILIQLAIGERMKIARKRRGITLRELAEMIGVAESTAQRYETAGLKVDITTIPIIADALGVDKNWLVCWDNEEAYISTLRDIAADNGIDISKMSEAEIIEVFNTINKKKAAD